MGRGHCGESSKHLRNFRLGTLNVITLQGRVCEVLVTLSRCYVQETRYNGGHCRIIMDNDHRYKTELIWKQYSGGHCRVIKGIHGIDRRIDPWHVVGRRMVPYDRCLTVASLGQCPMSLSL